jgi:hypothetical protein
VLLWKWCGLIAIIRLMGKVIISTVYLNPCIMTKNNHLQDKTVLLYLQNCQGCDIYNQ